MRSLYATACLFICATVTGCDPSRTESEDSSGIGKIHSDRVVQVSDLTSATAIDQSQQDLIRLDASNPGVPVLLEVNSDGGLISETLDFAAFVRGLESPVHTHTTHGANSIAAVVVAAGTPGHRSAGPDAIFSFPGIQTVDGSPLPAPMQEKIRAAILERLTEIIGSDGATVDAILNSNRTYSASEAVAAGLIDRIASRPSQVE